MTTLVALSTKDSLVMGCDSLASVTKPLVDPWDLREFFDDDFKIKTDAEGKPILNSFMQIYDKKREIPSDHMTHVSKLFSLKPLPMGIMIAGITSIGNRTIKSLISEFKRTDKAFIGERLPTNFTTRSIGERIKQFIWKHYSNEYPEDGARPPLEFLIGGYDKQSPIPSIYRIYIHKNELKATIKDFGIVFGGQMQEIQRIVFGSDIENKYKMIDRSALLLSTYHELQYNR
jgi:hypothetical protein